MKVDGADFNDRVGQLVSLVANDWSNVVPLPNEMQGEGKKRRKDKT